jgi:hypothetical protein
MYGAYPVPLKDCKGADPSEWPEDLRETRELPWREVGA